MKKDILGVIKLGQLKRIQAVLHKDWKYENRFKNRNWQEEIEFILKGKGGFIPVNISIDFDDKNSVLLLSDDSQITKNKIESILKLLVLKGMDYNLSKPR